MNTPTTEQRRRFEQLCLLRSLYARRGADDASSVMSLAELAGHVRAQLAEGPEPLSQPGSRQTA
jgi:hypothetical protein